MAYTWATGEDAHNELRLIGYGRTPGSGFSITPQRAGPLSSLGVWSPDGTHIAAALDAKDEPGGRRKPTRSC